MSAFFAGRSAQQKTLAAQAALRDDQVGLRAETNTGSMIDHRITDESSAERTHDQQITAPPMADANIFPSYRQLVVSDIMSRPFSEFYEALRSAPNEAREKWSAELEQMQPGPRRWATLEGFYKLLVQFDPKMATKSIRETSDKELQKSALGSVVAAAPANAMRELADLVNEVLQLEASEVIVVDLISQWSSIDPSEVAKYIDQHPEVDDRNRRFFRDTIILDWAALDPVSAKNWIEEKGISEEPEIRRSFVDGWYENDRQAAVAYVLAHADDPALKDAISDILRRLYDDSREQIREFIEDLPDEKSREDSFGEAFEWMAQRGSEEETGEAEHTPRAVADWMIQFPPNYWKGVLAQNLEPWIESSPEEVFDWIAQQPTTIRDAVAAEYGIPREKSPAEAISAILQVSDPNLRGQLLTACFEHAYHSADDVKNSILNSTLSSADKECALQILEQVRSRRDCE